MKEKNIKVETTETMYFTFFIAYVTLVGTTVITFIAALGNNFDAGVLFALTTGYVGSEAAITFVDFVKSYDRQVSLEDILDNGEFGKLEEWGINEYAAFVDKMEAADIFTIELTDVRAKNIAEFFATYAPSEVSMKLWTALTNGRNDDSNVIKFYTQVVSDGKPVSAHLVEMCGGNNEDQ